MKRVLVVGCGFAGLTAASRLARSGRFEVLAVDARPTCDFKPLLPDAIGHGFPTRIMRRDIAGHACENGFAFSIARVEGFDLARGRAATSAGAIEFDYLLLVPGLEPDFRGRRDMAARAFTLSSVDDCDRLTAALELNAHRTLVVVGGGYTGVEIASQLRLREGAGSAARRVIVVEASPLILPGLPPEFTRYMAEGLSRMGVEIRTSTMAAGFDGPDLALSTGEILPEALVIWTAGVRAPAFLQGLPTRPGASGRLRVDSRLQFGERAFAAGDAAGFMGGGSMLRPAFQFALSGGRAAAENIIRLDSVRQLRRFRPLDLGYVVPMADGRSCGKALGVPVWGRLATWMHYFMCAYRSYGTANRLSVARSALFGRRSLTMPASARVSIGASSRPVG